MWDIRCQSRHIQRPEIFKRFKAENNIASSNLGNAHSMLCLKDTLILGTIRSPEDTYFKRRHWNEEDVTIPYDIIDHGCFFKTRDNQVLFAAHSYSPIEEVRMFFSADWVADHGFIVNILDGSHSWRNESACLIVIMVNKVSPPIMV